nr:beta-ketoacyl-[acyl-carrier-protein] synthase family protein [uncultured Desulfobacter sp.]
MTEKICISGLGLIGPFGSGKKSFKEGISSGRSFLKPVETYESNHLAGAVPDFQIKDYIKDRRVLKYAPVTQYALAAAKMAVDEAGLNISKADPEKTAVFYATNLGSINITETICNTIDEKGYKKVNPILFQQSVFNTPASLLSILLGIQGPCISLPMGFSSGGAALDMAVNYFRIHDIDLALVIASDENAQVSHQAYDHLKLLSPNDDGNEGMRPFDANRNGFVASEGAAALVLEKENIALENQRSIYGYIAGSSTAGDAWGHGDVDPKGTGLLLAMKNALSAAGIGQKEIDLIVAMAPSDQKVDKMEAKAIRNLFNEHCDTIPVTSIKSSIGETFSPAGLFNLCAGLLTMADGKIPPTLNHDRPDPDINLDIVAGRAREKKVDTVLSNTFSWGGIYNSIVARRYE